MYTQGHESMVNVLCCCPSPSGHGLEDGTGRTNFTYPIMSDVDVRNRCHTTCLTRAMHYESRFLENRAAHMTPLTHMNFQIARVDRQKAVPRRLRDMGSLVSLFKGHGLISIKLSISNIRKETQS